MICHPERAAPCGCAAGHRESKDPAFDGIGADVQGNSQKIAAECLPWFALEPRLEGSLGSAGRTAQPSTRLRSG